MSFMHQIMGSPGREPADEQRPVPQPRRPAAPRPPAREDGADADFGEEFGHTVKKDGTAGGEGFDRDEYDKVV